MGEEHRRKAGGRARSESGLDTESWEGSRAVQKGLVFTRNADTALRREEREGQPLLRT